MKESEAVEAIQFDLKIGGEIHSQVLRDAVDVAIQALEKQIPMKPNKTIDSSWGTKKEVHTCPVCDCDLTEVYFIAPQESKIKEKITYCEACGQAIDWSDEE
nr:MAG TPA: zinc-ribbon containing domain protein [Bacteriophage sp.]